MPDLYHATAMDALDSIDRTGLKAGSYWTSDEDMLAYYMETIADEGRKPIVLVVDQSDAMKLLETQHTTLEPDWPGIDEPISTVLGMNEEQVRRQWVESARSWQDSLRIIKTVRCPIPLPTSILAVTDDLDGDLLAFADYRLFSKDRCLPVD